MILSDHASCHRIPIFDTFFGLFGEQNPSPIQMDWPEFSGPVMYALSSMYQEKINDLKKVFFSSLFVKIKIMTSLQPALILSGRAHIVH
jgi:hypothetical protein